jgi:oligopeptide transport system substrate-binding protein
MSQAVEGTNTPVEAAAVSSTDTPRPTSAKQQPTATPMPTDTPPPSPTPAPELIAVPTAASASEGLNAVYYYGFNAQTPPFDDVLVRKAFALALDRVALAEAVGDSDEYRKPATTFTPRDILGLELYGKVGLSHDPQRAQDLLAEAGYPNGTGLPDITLWYNELEDNEHRLIAEVAQEQWRETLAVEVNLRSKPWDEYLDMIYHSPPQVWRLGWAPDYVDPHNFLHNGICQNNESFFNSEEYKEIREAIANAHYAATKQNGIAEFSEQACNNWPSTRFQWTNTTYSILLERALRQQSSRKRRELYVQAERILCETDAVVIPIYHYIP